MFAFFVYKFEIPLSKRFFLVIKLAGQTTAAIVIGYQPVPTLVYNPGLPTFGQPSSVPDVEQTPFSKVPEFVPFVQPITHRQPSIRPPPFGPNEGKQISPLFFLSHHNLKQNFNLKNDFGFPIRMRLPIFHVTFAGQSVANHPLRTPDLMPLVRRCISRKVCDS